MTRNAPLLALLLLAGACDSSSSGTADGALLTLSGDVTGDFAATATSTQLDDSRKTSVTVAATPMPSGFRALTISVEIEGAPTARDYSVSELKEANAAITTSASKMYAASLGGVGTFSALHVTSVVALGSSGTVTTYTLHGTLDATLAPLAGGSSVTLVATF